jgi:biopolymer transport protein ExbB
MALDPSRGSILSLWARAPGLLERIQQGRFIGYLILASGLCGMLLAAERVAALAVVGRRVAWQEQHLETAAEDNPLGRLLATFAAHRERDPESLVLRLEEQTQREIPKLQRGLSALAVLATTAPLLGLLGTVTGMIATFQSIALVGTGDPRLMSSGISEALVTTALGLIVAIPLSLLHAFVSSRSSRVMQVLDERCARIVAERVEAAADAREPTHGG